MAGQRNTLKMWLLILIFVTCAIVTNGHKPILRMPQSASSEENLKPRMRGTDHVSAKKPILRQGPSLSSSSSSSSEEEIKEIGKKPIREGQISDSDNSGSGEEEPDNGPRMTKAILRDQELNGEASDKRRKKRNAIFYRTQPARED